MKPEPLTNKRINLIIERLEALVEDENVKEFHKCLLRRCLAEAKGIKEDLKNVREWLLKEIEKEIDRIEINKSNAPWDYRIANLFSKEVDGFIKGLKFAKNLIKKAFSGVLE